jgi:enoyl-CoA hydratase/carnithine racemase
MAIITLECIEKHHAFDQRMWKRLDKAVIPSENNPSRLILLTDVSKALCAEGSCSNHISSRRSGEFS